jgi:hypothetical protein
MAGESHFDDGREQAAVGTIMIGENFSFATELLDRLPEIFEVGGMVDVGRNFTGLGNDLRKDRAAEAVFGTAEIDEEESGIADC